MGKIFDIQRFCTSDGPGIRTTVFFKGCPLKCVWCHNPESQDPLKELSYNPALCTGCGRCVSRCENGCHTLKNSIHTLDREKCTVCGRCVNPVCDALSVCGREASADEVINEVIKDKPFYENSGGGMTLSGGEPLFQPDFCIELLKRARELGINTCMETCGYASSDVLGRAAEYTDLFLFDCKELCDRLHKEYTGVGNTVILRNLDILDALKKDVALRCPVIPGFNDRPEHFEAIARLSESLGCIKRIEIEPYHSFGINKYVNLGRTYTVPEGCVLPSEETVEKWINAISEKTGKPVKKA